MHVHFSIKKSVRSFCYKKVIFFTKQIRFTLKREGWLTQTTQAQEVFGGLYKLGYWWVAGGWNMELKSTSWLVTHHKLFWSKIDFCLCSVFPSFLLLSCQLGHLFLPLSWESHEWNKRDIKILDLWAQTALEIHQLHSLACWSKPWSAGLCRKLKNVFLTTYDSLATWNDKTFCWGGLNHLKMVV